MKIAKRVLGVLEITVGFVFLAYIAGDIQFGFAMVLIGMGLGQIVDTFQR